MATETTASTSKKGLQRGKNAPLPACPVFISTLLECVARVAPASEVLVIGCIIANKRYGLSRTQYTTAIANQAAYPSPNPRFLTKPLERPKRDKFDESLFSLWVSEAEKLIKANGYNFTIS